MDSILFTKIKEKISERKKQLTTLKVESVIEPEKERLNGNQRLQEALFIVGLLATIFITVSLLSFNPADPAWTQTSWSGKVENAGGSLGAWIADTLFFAFGSLAYLLPVILMGCTWLVFRKKEKPVEKAELDLMIVGSRILGLLILFFTSCALADTSFDDLWYFSSGGVVGDVLTSITTPTLNLLGSTLIFMFLWGAGLTLFTGLSWLTIVDNLGGFVLECIRIIVNKMRKTEDETYQVEDDINIDESEKTLLDTPSFTSIKEEQIVDIDPFETPKISSQEVLGLGNESTYEHDNSLELFDDPLFSPSTPDTLKQEVKVTEEESVTNVEIMAGIDSSEVLVTSELVETATEFDLANKPTVSELLDGMDDPEDLDDGISLVTCSEATIAELESEAQEKDPLLNLDNAEKTAPFLSMPEEPIIVQNNHDNHEILAQSTDEQLEEELTNEPKLWQLEEERTFLVQENNDLDSDADLEVSTNTEAEMNEVFSTQLEPIEEVVINEEPLLAQEPFSLDDDELPAFSAIAEESDTESSLNIEANDIFEEVTAEELVSEELVPAEELPTHSDADIAAFQALVAKEKATKAALQNPFLVQSEANLPKPTSPMPTLDLLYAPDTREELESRESLERTARLVEAKLADYKIKARVVDIFPGPVITRFELDLAPGVKVSRISGLATDLARSLSAMAVRVVEVIPGKPYVGLELPNFNRQTVFFSDVVGSDTFKNAKSPTTVVMGLDIAGEAVIADLAKMPHVLVAGTTGSGKSVGVNVMILSVLYKATPEDVRFIMIDPKMLELSIYEGIPHLLTEVVTDMKDAGNALRWCVGEMERRYKLMSALGVRNLQGFNDKLKMAAAAGHPIHDPLWKPGDSMDEMPPLLEKLPSIIVIVDEFADLMMVVGKKVEELIARLAQKARAAGIHLILATQRPSVDVITGLIKANIPTRVAFTVSTKTDSRTILDQGGAESLLGMGDMLYLAPGSNHTVRVHGAFASDDDVHAVVNDWKARGRPNYIEAITKSEQGAESLLPGEKSDNAEELDQLFDQVVEFVTTSRRGSVSGVQRQFRIGYNRAARIVEQLEAHGIVSTPGHNGNREVIAPPPVGSGD